MNDAFWVGVDPGLSEEMLAFVASELVTALQGPVERGGG